MVESKKKTMQKKDVKTFEDLEKEVIHNDLCCACGACVSYCESQAFDVIKMVNYTPQFKSDKNAENCTECGVCYYICPQTEPILEQITQKYKIEDETGHIEDVLAAKTTNEKINELGQDGGVVTTLLTYLFDRHLIDAAVVSQYDEKLEPKPKLVFNKEELLKSAGTRYSVSPQFLPLKDLYNLGPESLKEGNIYDINSLRVAFVGTPCQLRALRKMHYLNISPAHVIKYVIGLFCFENFDYKKLYDILKKKTKTEPSEIQKTWIKKNFFLKTKEGDEHEVNIKKLDPAVRSNCHECDEFTSMFSDISVGASGAPQGYSMIIIRTETGEELVNHALANEYIERYIVPPEKGQEWKQKKKEWFKKMVSFKTK
ncbi:MAG: Coenzyme F420 hydrogenase/dehydrogenase, beta subunit C-terminal domain [Promethearchaeia archaeon]